MQYVFLIIAFILNATANIFLKIASQKGLYLNFSDYLGLIKNNLFLIFGFVFFAMNTFFYFLALKNIPISLAYPIMVAASFMIIGSYAFYNFHEQITSYHIVGYFLILIGIAITFINSAK